MEPARLYVVVIIAPRACHARHRQLNFRIIYLRFVDLGYGLADQPNAGHRQGESGQSRCFDSVFGTRCSPIGSPLQ